MEDHTISGDLERRLSALEDRSAALDAAGRRKLADLKAVKREIDERSITTPFDHAAARRQLGKEAKKLMEDIAELEAILNGPAKGGGPEGKKAAKRGGPGRPFKDPRGARGDEIRRAGFAEILALAMRDAPKRKG